MKERLQSAVREMQADLQTQLKGEHLRLFSIVGRGGFGTVYHGACRSFLFGCGVLSGVMGP
jgi:hypothetical protein